MIFDEYRPLTSRVGFIQCDIERVSKEFSTWMNGIFKSRAWLESNRIPHFDLFSCTEILSPLTRPVETKNLFASLANGWALFLDNHFNGSSAADRLPELARRLKTRSFNIVYEPHTLRGRTGRYGATMFSYEDYSGETRKYRSVAAANDGGKWVFEAFGDPLPFENLERYQNKRKRDRLLWEDLVAYANALGIDLDNEDYYTSKEAVLFERKGTPPEQQEFFTFQEVRERFGHEV